MTTWMADNYDVLKDLTLDGIVIPGSHDSGSYCISRSSKPTNVLPNLVKFLDPIIEIIGAKWSKTQSMTIKDQLENGIRYLDLRVYLDPDDKVPFLVHGYEAAPLDDELIRIKDFTDNYPGEYIILDINHVYEFTKEDIFSLLSQLQDVFSTKLLPPKSAGSGMYTYGDIVASKQTITIAITETSSFTYQEVVEKFPFMWSSEGNIISPWGNTADITELKKFLVSTMSKVRPTNAHHVTQAILSPKAWNIIKGLFVPPKSLLKLSEKLKPYLPQWIQEFSSLKLNIIIIDFISKDLIDELIDLNLKTYSNSGEDTPSDKETDTLL